MTSVGRLLTQPAAYAAMANAVNPYGDGQAADRAVAAIAHHFGLGPAAGRIRQHARADRRPRLPRVDGGVKHAEPARAHEPQATHERQGRVNKNMHHRRLRTRLLAAVAVCAAIPLALSAIPLALSAVPASAAPRQAAASTTPGARTPLSTDRTPALPAPPKPPAGLPKQAVGYQAPTALVSGSARQAIIDARQGAHLTAAASASAPAAVTAAASASAPAAATAAALVTPSQARTWGGSGSATTLVALRHHRHLGLARSRCTPWAAGNLASHFGKVTAEPVANYVSGQVNNYTATIYLGSTYNEPVPAAFLNDVLSTTHPVIWSGSNIWQLTGTEGSTADTAFKAVYGWDPSNSYFDTTDNPVDRVSTRARRSAATPATAPTSSPPTSPPPRW